MADAGHLFAIWPNANATNSVRVFLELFKLFALLVVSNSDNFVYSTDCDKHLFSVK